MEVVTLRHGIMVKGGRGNCLSFRMDFTFLWKVEQPLQQVLIKIRVPFEAVHRNSNACALYSTCVFVVLLVRQCSYNLNSV